MIERRKSRFKKIYWAYFIVIELLLLSYVVAYAAEKISTPGPSWHEHADLMTMIILGCLSIIGAFIIRLLNRIDKNQALLFERQNQFNERLSTLEGEHRAIAYTHERK